MYINDEPVGTLSRTENEFIFRYDDAYYQNPEKKAISVTLPKTRQEYRSKTFFPFFFNMLSEGVNKQVQCRQLRIDENDFFGLLLATGSSETIGAVTVRPLNNNQKS